MSLVDNLKTFGLTDYEAKAYSALISINTGSVTEISQLCEVPRSNLYGVLESLNSKGFVDIQKGRPIVFKATDPKAILSEVEKTQVESIKSSKKEAIERLGKIQKKKKVQAEPALFWTIKGSEAVLAKIEEMIKNARKEILINAPDMRLFDKMYDELVKAKKKGIKIKIATQKNQDLTKYKKIGIVRTRDQIHGIDIVTDEKEILISLPFAIVAGWIDNKELALHVKDFLSLVWKDALSR